MSKPDSRLSQMSAELRTLSAAFVGSGIPRQSLRQRCKTSTFAIGSNWGLGLLASWLIVLGLGPTVDALAQQRTTTGATRAGGGTSPTSGTSSGTTRQYTPNGTVGDAMISVDPETRRVIVITDEETSKYVGQVITNLDRPEPQVLIKVVFLEVTHDNSSDIGIEGAYGHTLNNTTTGIVANAFGLSALNSSPSTNLVNAFGQP